MEVEYIKFLRMATFLFSLLLLFLQLPGNFASVIEIQSKVCGVDHLAHWGSNGCSCTFIVKGSSEVSFTYIFSYESFFSNYWDSRYAHRALECFGHELFYLNGNLVDRVSFCKAFQHYADACAFEGCVGSDLCELDPPLAELPFRAVRKLLEKEAGGGKGITDDGQTNLQGKKNYEESLSTQKKLGILATGFVAMCCACLCPCFYRKRKPAAHSVLARDPMDSTSSFEMNPAPEKIPASPFRVPPSPSRFSMSPQLSRIGSIHLTMTQVARATHNFSPSQRIGEGGFGTVYKAQLDTGQVVAIKRAKKEHFESLQTEFSSEVELLAKIEHRNLVKLLGYIDRGNERLIITEFVPNGTLREHLDGQHGKILDFNQRLEIAIDVAHGLTYLHLYTEKQIIHRDVKSSNILLTETMRAKVADFGFARLGPVDSDQTHISTKVKGTVGYLDPEYMRTYQLTPKSDVYSFGVLLIEILTGRRPVELKKPVEERVTLRWAFNSYNKGNIMDMVDPLMEEAIDTEILVKMLDLAFQCAAPIRNDRPDMKSVGEQLWAIRADYLKSKRG